MKQIKYLINRIAEWIYFKTITPYSLDKSLNRALKNVHYIEMPEGIVSKNKVYGYKMENFIGGYTEKQCKKRS